MMVILFLFIWLKVPVGRATLGRIMNVIGEPIDERCDISKCCCFSMIKTSLKWLKKACVFSNKWMVLQKLITIYQFIVKLQPLWSKQLNSKFLSLVSRYFLAGPICTWWIPFAITSYLSWYGGSCHFMLVTVFCVDLLHKVVNLLAPYQRGKIGLFGGAGVGDTVLIMELITNLAKAHGWFLILCIISYRTLPYLKLWFVLLFVFLVRWFSCLCWCRRTNSRG